MKILTAVLLEKLLAALMKAVPQNHKCDPTTKYQNVNENPNILSMLIYRKFPIIGTCIQPLLLSHVTFLLIPSRVYFPSLGLWTKIKAQRRGSIKGCGLILSIQYLI
jgi:hypothetical protein